MLSLALLLCPYSFIELGRGTLGPHLSAKGPVILQQSMVNKHLLMRFNQSMQRALLAIAMLTLSFSSPAVALWDVNRVNTWYSSQPWLIGSFPSCRLRPTKTVRRVCLQSHMSPSSMRLSPPLRLCAQAQIISRPPRSISWRCFRCPAKKSLPPLPATLLLSVL